MFFWNNQNWDKRNREISMSPQRFQVVTPEEYIKIYNQNSANILSVRIIPPRIGSNNFGKILIEWKNPVYASFDEFEGSAFA